MNRKMALHNKNSKEVAVIGIYKAQGYLEMGKMNDFVDTECMLLSRMTVKCCTTIKQYSRKRWPRLGVMHVTRNKAGPQYHWLSPAGNKGI